MNKELEIKEDKSFGVIPVFKNKTGSFLFCLIFHSKGHWGFPKGHPYIDESEEETALRELKEETGISTFKLINDIWFIEKYSFKKDDYICNKSVKYFLGLVPSTDTMTLNDFKKEIPELRWVTYEEARQIILPEMKDILDEVSQLLTDKF